MNHILLTIYATPEEQAILIAHLSEIGAVGFEETNLFLLCYFYENELPRDFVNQVLTSHKFEETLLEERNWNAVWEENFEPVVVEGFCAIRAHFHEPVDNVALEIVITPKMSFGTGHHATTYMMIQQMKKLNFKDRDVFDFGTGTGILAILAKKLGASGVTAIDVDEWSIKNAAENFERNGITDIVLYESSLLPDRTYDIILANINRHILLQYTTGLKNLITPNGYLLLSGILVEDEAEICSSFAEETLNLITRKKSGNWLSLLFRR